MKADPKKVFEPYWNPKNSIAGPNKAQKAPNGARLETKIQGYTSKTKVDSLYVQVSKNIFEPDPNLKNSPVWAYKATNRAEF